MKFSRVICLIRGDDTDTEVIDTAISLLGGNNRSIRFVYVIVVDRHLALDDPDIEEYSHAEQVLMTAEQTARGRGEARGVILQARSIAPVLIREALDYGADGIVASTRVLTSIGKKTVDSDSEHLLINAPCAVLLQREAMPGFEPQR